MRRFAILLWIGLITSACSQNQPYGIVLADTTPSKNTNPSSCDQSLMGPLTYEQYHPAAQHVSQFVRRIHEDRQGNLWLGTNGDGILKYNGDSLEYLSTPQGFAGVAVRGIIEDREGFLWFGTENGLSKYNPSTNKFTNYREENGLAGNDIWSLLIDSKGMMWIGTLKGASTFDGKTFKSFDLPETEPDYSRGVTSSKIVHSIMEDSKGKMWFATNDGAYIYDGKKLSNLSVKDGLCGRVVNDILEDQQGNIWFATHHHGVCRWDGKNFTYFDEDDQVNGTEAWSLFEDSQGGVWFPTEGYGLYRSDGEHFAHYHTREGLASGAIQCVFEDSKGHIWCGGWMGLFRLEGQHFIPVSKNGPWENGC